MASLSIRRLDDEVVRRLKVRALRESVSLEELARRILRDACAADTGKVGTTIREIFGGGVDLEIPPREALPDRVDFSGPEYGPDDE